MDQQPTRPFRPVIRSQADLERAWRHLMEPLGFSGASIWMMLIDAADRPVPQITEIQDCARVPDAAMLDGFATLAGELRDDLAPGGRWALLRSRPGGATVTAADRAWARGLVSALHQHGVPTEVVHLATDVDLLPLPFDVLAA